MNKNSDTPENIAKKCDSALILAVETSGRTGSVAIAQEDTLLAEAEFSEPMKHSREVFGAINELLSRLEKRPEQIEQIYISVGPGSFTGLRIAVTIAKIMHLAAGTKIVAVNTLDAIAQNGFDFLKDSSANRIAVILDAKRTQFFTAVYEKTLLNAEKENNYKSNSAPSPRKYWNKLFDDCLMTAEDFKARFAKTEKQIYLLGEGLVYYKEDFRAAGVDFLPESCWRPKAASIHTLGRQLAKAGKFADPLALQPTYIQRPDAKAKSS